MNFFDAQERSHRNTRWLILVMTLAVIAVVISVTAVVIASVWLIGSVTTPTTMEGWALSNPDLVAWTALGVTTFIGLASLFKVVTLRQGGGKVARDLGGTLIGSGDTDPLRRRLHNVVEEMAIASGIPTPEVYVLDHEPGINAFAAGFSTEDAAVAVTRGTLETLDRDELQGVIAHEFSHIFNGDMRLNIKLMGPIFGILAIGLLGRILLSNMRFSSRSSNSRGGTSVVMALGAGLSITGFVGLLLARIIKAGVSRQREYLADASAVQFTRQTRGIAGALKKIAGYKEHSTINSSDAEEVSHMLFASGFSSISGFLATHPPLLNRIQAIEPSFSEANFTKLHMEMPPIHPDQADGQTAGFAGATAETNLDGSIDAVTLIDSVGNPVDAHYVIAQEFNQQIPAEIRDALDSDYQAMLLLPALILNPENEVRAQQLAAIEQQLGRERRERIQALYEAVAQMSGEARLPLLHMALPRVKEQPLGRLNYLGDLLEQLARQDNRLELFEYALLRIYQRYIEIAANPGMGRNWRTLDDKDMRQAAVQLMTVFAEQGHTTHDHAEQALARGLAALDIGEVQRSPTGSDSADWLQRTDNALIKLQNCTPRDREKLIRALIDIALDDGHISQIESELLRAFCAILECPLPPIVASH